MSGIIHRLLENGFPAQRCPDCDGLISANDINIKEGVALCPDCGKLGRLSELRTSGRAIAEILAYPPSGCHIVSDGQRVRATISLRSLSGFVATAGFALFWNGITSVFVLIAIAGLYANLIGPLPDWFPAPGLQEGKPEMNGGPMSLGMTLFLWVFLSPFILVGVVVAGTAIMNLIGRIDVVIDPYDSYVATGFSIFQWRKRFDPRDVQSVDFGATRWQTEGKVNRLLEIKGAQTTQFGSMLQLEQLEWLRAVLRQILLPQNDKLRSMSLPGLDWLSQQPR